MEKVNTIRTYDIDIEEFAKCFKYEGFLRVVEFDGSTIRIITDVNDFPDKVNVDGMISKHLKKK